MKTKIFAFCLLLVFAFLFFACSSGNDDKKDPEIEVKFSLKENSFELNVNEEHSIEALEFPEGASFTLTSDNPSVVTVDGMKVKAVGKGTAKVTVKMTLGDKTKEATVYVKVLEPALKLTGVSELGVGDSEMFSCQLTDIEGTVTWSVSDSAILSVNGGVVTGLKPGKAKVIATLGELKDELEVTVVSKIESAKFLINTVELDYGADYQLTYEIKPEGNFKVEFISSDPTIAYVSDSGLVTPTGVGDVVITLRVNDGEAEDRCYISIYDVDGPEFILSGVEKRQTIGWNVDFDPLQGITATDNFDGDVTSNIQIISNDLNTKKYGLYTIRYRVSDSQGNKTNLIRYVEVKWQYDVIFIGHAGCFYGLMNSEEAFLYAVDKLHYQAVECDVKQTKDGVFVMSHDDTFGDKTIASCNWSELENYEINKGRTGGIPSQNGSVTGSPYTTKLCTLARYLEICKSYGAKAVIELKSSSGITNSDQSRMQALMDEIEKAGMRDDVIFLGSQYNCLIWTREHGYEDIPCQYLVNSLDSQTVLDRCIKYNLDVSCNVTSTYTNSEEWMAKYHEAGLKISTWTFTQYVDYNVVQEWIDKGADFVTCDWHLMENLDLSDRIDIPRPTHKVTFKDSDGTVLKEVNVIEGKTAAAPTVTAKTGYKFAGWDKEITNIQEDLVVTAIYDLEVYSINYMSNLTTIEEGTWADKAEFVNTLYGDLIAWFKSNGVNSEYVTVDDNGKITITKNGVTVSFSNVEELIAVDIYDYEKTVSNFFFKPLERDANGNAIIVDDDNYFINTGVNKFKYASFDAYLMNCRAQKYPAYDDTYTPTSAGKIQIFFRFHQWVRTTNTSLIPPFETLPTKYTVVNAGANVQMPTEHLTYTIEDEFDLPSPTGVEGLVFVGWFLDSEFTKPITKIEKGSTGDLVLYSKWDQQNN